MWKFFPKNMDAQFKGSQTNNSILDPTFEKITRLLIWTPDLVFLIDRELWMNATIKS